MDIKAGDTIAIRIPINFPEHISEYLTKMKQEKKRQFSSFLLSIIVDYVESEMKTRNGCNITLNISDKLTNEQMNWLNRKETKELLTNILVYALCEKNDKYIAQSDESSDVTTKEALNESTRNYILSNFLND